MTEKWYGTVDCFDYGATDKEILDQMPDRFDRVLRTFRANAEEINGQIDVRTLTIIFKSADKTGGPLEAKAILGVKAKIVN